MLRQKMEPGWLYIVYLFQHHLKLTLGLGNEENSLSDKQSCNNFCRTPLITVETVFVSENVLPAMVKRMKFKYM